VMRTIYSDHLIERPGKLLISKEGCDRQPYHFDFDPDEKYQDDEMKPLVLFVGLSPSSRAELVPKEGLKPYTVVYGMGDLLIMNGLQLHRGCSYREENFRLYFNASHHKIKQSNKDTKNTFLPEEQPTRRNKFNL
jgi:hypothetical protein